MLGQGNVARVVFADLSKGFQLKGKGIKGDG